MKKKDSVQHHFYDVRSQVVGRSFFVWGMSAAMLLSVPAMGKNVVGGGKIL